MNNHVFKKVIKEAKTKKHAAIHHNYNNLLLREMKKLEKKISKSSSHTHTHKYRKK